MRSEELYLHGIVDAADAIHRFLKDVSKDAFLTDEMRQSAVLQKLIITGKQFPDYHKIFGINILKLFEKL